MDCVEVCVAAFACLSFRLLAVKNGRDNCLFLSLQSVFTLLLRHDEPVSREVKWSSDPERHIC